MGDFISKITDRHYPYFIAEIGINHNGDVSLAKSMIEAAYECGADCVKFQSFIADEYISEFAQKASYQKVSAFEEISQREIIGQCQLSEVQMRSLHEFSINLGIDFLSTPFEITSLYNLLDLGLPAIKVSSCNLTNVPFLNQVALSSTPTLLSTGMGEIDEVAAAVRIFKEKQVPLLLFQCTSNYPSKPEHANLSVIGAYQNLFQIPIGLSDHTESDTTSIAAVALGAVAIEKHFTLSRSLPGIDQASSLEPQDLKRLIVNLKECKDSLGEALKKRTSEENDTALALRRSLVAGVNIAAGEVVDDGNLTIMRPGTGIPPNMLSHIVGKKLVKSAVKGEILTWDHFIT
ncbi:N-acetylneuraminate synthase family protein [Alphaproteobacteria bacterium]|nr:N-acetylneuraminate synthase family protein [Alphaproteobacteria bacterium]